jgi:hypothetical protein
VTKINLTAGEASQGMERGNKARQAMQEDASEENSNNNTLQAEKQ